MEYRSIVSVFCRALLITASALIVLTLSSCKLEDLISVDRKIKDLAVQSSVHFNVLGLTLTEGGSATIAVQLAKVRTVDTVVNIDLINDSGASAALDFSALPSTVTIPAGALEAPLTILTVNDSTYEVTKAFKLWLETTDPALGLAATSIPIALLDDDPAPTVLLTVAAPLSGSYINSGNYLAVAANGTCSENGQLVQFGGSLVGSTMCAGGVWSTTLNFLSVADGAVALNFSHSSASAISATPVAITMTKDIVAPTAIITGQPTGTDPTTTLAITVSGTGVSNYIYKVGTGVTADCTTAGYSASQAVASPITSSISGLADGPVWICVLGLDVAGNLQSSGSATSATWTKDTTLPATPTVVLSDSGSSSTVNTALALTNLSITSDTDAVKWCVLEQASATAAPTAPSLANGCWVATRPTTVTLGAQGSRTVYVYTQDSATNISSPAATASINYTTLSAFAISGVSGGTDVTVNAWLNGNTANPTITWAASTGATSYDVTVYEMDGTTVKCALSNVATLSKTFGTCSLTDVTSYKAVVVAKDSSGSLTASNSPYIFTYSAYGTTELNVFASGTVPVSSDDSDATPVELGMAFKSDVGGFVKGVRFYKTSNNTGAHTGTLWTSAGVQLATVTFTGETATGWQQMNFATPVAISANTTYVVSYWAPVGRYVGDLNYFATDRQNGVLHGLAHTVPQPNGLYHYSSSAFPTDTYMKGNYYVDVAFAVQSAAPGAFSITGISGGVDGMIDDLLQDVASPTVNWASALGASSYAVTIFNDDGTTVRCAQTSVAANVTAYNFASCSLPVGAYYKARVIAADADGVTTTASNSLYRFYAGDPAAALTIEAVYPSHTKWLDYISNDGVDHYHATEIACSAGSANTPGECLHAGIYRKVRPIGISSCTGITAADSLGAFKWRCDDSRGAVVIYLGGFKDTKSLGDIISSGPTWRTNVLTVSSGGTPVANSTASAWWTNTLTALPTGAGVQTLSTSGTIYVFATDVVSNGHFIDGNNIGIVGLPGATIRYGGSAAFNCNWSGGAVAADTRCIVFGSGQFLWYEGTFRGDASPKNAEHAIAMQSVDMGTIRNVNISNIIGDNYPWSIIATGGTVSRFENIRIHGSGHGAFYAAGAPGSVLQNINLSGTGSTALMTYDEVVATSVTLSSSGDGITLYSSGATIGHTTTNNGGWGGVLLMGQNATVFSVVDGSRGLAFDGGSSNNKVEYSKFSGVATGGTGNVYSNNVSTAANMTNTFVGKVTTNDVANSSDASGTATYALALDWFNFDNSFRAWGVDLGAAYPAPSNDGGWFSGVGRIWDWRVRSTDNVIYNRSGFAAANAANGAFIAGAACPTAAGGSITTTDALGRAFLINALEINTDGVGNDNGLCESNEDCIYAPNIGSYQGEGDYYAAGTCTFAPGAVTGVKLYAYPTNGI